MTLWLNRATVQYSGSTGSVTINPASGGTLLSGTRFTPTAGRLLVALVSGGITATTPSGWTLPTGGSAVGNSGLYLFTKTAAGSDTLTTTNNGAGYPGFVDFFEFEEGSIFVSSVAATGVANAASGPTVTGLGGTLLCVQTCAMATFGALGSASYSHGSGTEVDDIFIDFDGSHTGIVTSSLYVDGVTATTWAGPTATCTSSANTQERLSWAVYVSTSATALTATSLAAAGSTTNTSPYTTASISPAANSLLIAAISATGTSVATPTISGLSLTWNLITADQVGTGKYLAIYSAQCGASPGSGTCSIGISTTPTGCAWSITQVQHHDTTTPIVQHNFATGTSTGPAVTLSAAGASGNRTLGFATAVQTTGITPEAGWFEISEVGYSTPSNRLGTGWNPAAFDATVTATIGASVLWGITALELAAVSTGTPYTGTATDTVSISDAPTQAATTRTRTAADSVPISDAAPVQASATRTRAAADTVPVSDAPTQAARTRTRTAADTVPVSDAAPAQTVTRPARVRTSADTIPVGDALAGAAARARTSADTVPVTDAAPAQTVTRPARVRTATDTVPVTDVAVGAVPTTTDDTTLILVDSTVLTADGRYLSVAPRTTGDTVPVSDGLVRAAASRARTSADSVPVSDAAPAQTVTRPVRTRTSADTVPVSDAAAQGAAGRTRTSADSVPVSDSPGRVRSGPRTAGDSVPVADGLVGSPAKSRAVADSVPVSDATPAQGAATRTRTATDSVPVSDAAPAQTVTRPPRTRTAADSVPISDAVVGALTSGLTRTAADTVAISDAAPAQTVTRPVRVRTAADSVPVSDALGRTPNANRLIFPFYIYPNPTTEWDRIIADHSGIAYLIADDRSGYLTGFSPDANYTAVLARAKAAGVPLAYYVDSNYAATSAADVMANMDTWVSFYGPPDAWFVDQCSPSAANITYHQTIYTHAAGKPVIINHGTTPDEAFLSTPGVSDIDCIVENTASVVEPWTYPSWLSSYPPTRFYALAYNSTNLTTTWNSIPPTVYYRFISDTAVWFGLPAFLTAEQALGVGASRTRTAADTVPVSDSPARVTPPAVRTATDTVPVSDAAPVRAPSTRTRTATDTVPVSDSPARTAGHARPATDTVTITDAAPAQAATTRTRPVADTVPVADAVDRGGRFTDAFESGTTAAWPTVTGAPPVLTAAAATGTYGLRLSPANSAKQVGTSTTKWPQTEGWAALAFRVRFNALPTIGTSADIITLSNGLTVNNFDFYVRSTTGTFTWDVLGTDFIDTGIVPVLGVWYTVEARVWYGSTVYTAEVRINGAAQGTVTSVGQTATFVRSMSFGASATTKTYEFDLDDVQINVLAGQPAPIGLRPLLAGVADTVPVTDAAVGVIGAYNAADTVPVSDVVAQAATSRARTAADTVPVSDGTTRTGTRPRTAADTVPVSDAAPAQTVTRPARVRTATDTVPVSDAAVGSTPPAVRAATDTVPVSDAAPTQGTASRPRTAADTVPVTDTPARTVTVTRPLADTVPVSDAAPAQTVTRPARVRTGADTVPVADAPTQASAARARTGADSVPVSEALTRAPAARARTTGDAVPVSDGLTRGAAGHPRSVADVVPVADFPPGLQHALPADTVPVSDVTDRALFLGTTAHDTVPITGVPTARTARHFTTGDTVTITDLPVQRTPNVRAVGDLLTILDSPFTAPLSGWRPGIKYRVRWAGPEWTVTVYEAEWATSATSPQWVTARRGKG